MTTNRINVLDHGFVTLRNIAGPTRRAGALFDAHDTDVANAARLSFEGQDQDRTYEDEMKLNRYLMKNHHDTPFEVIVVWLEMKLPIFVARQLVRQRTQTINEASGRYIQLPPEWYIPEVVGMAAGNKKQGQVAGLPAEDQGWFQDALNEDCARGYALYKDAIARGIAMEHARMFLHVNHYTHWMETMNLRNLIYSFLRLRRHPHAQIESQRYAQATFELLQPHIPGLMKLYEEFFA